MYLDILVHKFSNVFQCHFTVLENSFKSNQLKNSLQINPLHYRDFLWSTTALIKFYPQKHHPPPLSPSSYARLELKIYK